MRDVLAAVQRLCEFPALLECLSRAPNATASLASLGAYTGMDPKDLQSSEEPYLLRAGYVVVGPGGRMLTERGRAYLAGE